MEGVPRSDLFDDVYFSADDGPGETQHVFLDGNNLAERWQGLEAANGRFTIGETGFGTGLNFLLAWELFDRMAAKGAFLDFISIEKYPMSVEDIRKGLSPWADRLSPYLEKMLGQYPMRVPGFHRIVFDNRVALTLIFGDANDELAEIEGSVDAWFLDGFTPSKNPDMWTDKVFTEMARLSHDGTTFATFTSAGFVKRGLREAGFTVEKRNGFGRKRDMLAGYFTGQKAVAQKSVGEIAIHGAGLAGCAAAYVLRQYGFEPILYDPNGIASGASGNPVGIINPRFTAFRGPESDFYTSSFALAARVPPNLDCGYRKDGALHLITDEDREKRLSRTMENWGWAAEHMQYLSAREASEIAGVDLKHAALYLPDSAQINPSRLCKAYADGVPFEKKEGEEADIVLYANGPALDFPWLHTVRGQLTFVQASEQSAKIKTNIHYGGYLSAALNGAHVVGSTFQKWMVDTNPLPEDDESNLQKLKDILPDLGELTVTGHRAALRTSAQDRFPVIGILEEGRLISTGHGSHGIASSIMAAHVIADFLRGGPFCLGKSTLKALAPMRFEARENRRNLRKS